MKKKHLRAYIAYSRFPLLIALLMFYHKYINNKYFVYLIYFYNYQFLWSSGFNYYSICSNSTVCVRLRVGKTSLWYKLRDALLYIIYHSQSQSYKILIPCNNLTWKTKVFSFNVSLRERICGDLNRGSG